ncbi:pectinesterase family protein [Sediminibacterium soli]|uniref:pectinesterase family protein n=1 Tax=Sediminibacterium soli TaxID=2698829 RepID=UPI00192A27E9|nr:pectinesterase family protein [Sediminibacterium soli]
MTALFLFAQQRTVVVAQDGSGDCRTVQQALDAVPAGNKAFIRIRIKKGVYRERLELAKGKDFVHLIGDDPASTVLTYDNHTGTILPNGDTVNTYTSASFFLLADNVTAENICFENNAGFNAGQAVAVFAKGDKLAFRNCRFTGFQDVLFCSGEGSRQYYKNCYIEGTTDFIFGPATAVFEECRIHSKKNSHVTAASTPADKAFGFVFLRCQLTGDSSLHHVSLGRPWRPYAAVAYLHCEISAHILPAGWNNWKNPANENTARFYEYRNTGPGAAKDARINWSKQLQDDEARRYTPAVIFPGWQPLFQ